MKITITIVYLLCVLWALWLYIAGLSDTPYNTWFNIGYASIFLLGSIFGLVKLKQFPDLKWIYMPMSLSMFTYVIAQVVWFSYNYFLQVEVPYPSWADLFYVLFYVFMLRGFVNLLIRMKIKFSIGNLLEMAIVFGLIFGLTYALIQSNAQSGSSFVLAKILDLLYPALDALMVTLAILALRTNIGSLKSSLLFFVAGFVVLGFGDTIFSLQTAFGTYFNGGLADLVLATSGAILAMAITEVNNIVGNVTIGSDKTSIAK